MFVVRKTVYCSLMKQRSLSLHSRMMQDLMEKSSDLNEIEDHLIYFKYFQVTGGILLIAYLFLLHMLTNPKRFTKF